MEKSDIDLEAERLAGAARKAGQSARAERSRKLASLRGWSLLTAIVALPGVVAFAAPDQVAALIPGTQYLYKKAGIAVNPHGFEVHNIHQQYVAANGTVVLTVRGEVLNVSGYAKKVPPLRFIIRNAQKDAVYAWNLNGVSVKALQPGRRTSFVTRVAAPPKTADEIEIRFATGAKIGS